MINFDEVAHVYTINIVYTCVNVANGPAKIAVSPIYIIITNPLSRLEVIMQTSSIKNKSITLSQAIREVINDSKTFGLRGVFRGQGIGMTKAVVSLTMFHEGRIFLTNYFFLYQISVIINHEK